MGAGRKAGTGSAPGGRWAGPTLWIAGLLLSICRTPTAAPVDDDGAGGQTLSVPFALSDESFGTAAGYVLGEVGFPQPQASLLGAVMAGQRLRWAGGPPGPEAAAGRPAVLLAEEAQGYAADGFMAVELEVSFGLEGLGTRGPCVSRSGPTSS